VPYYKERAYWDFLKAQIWPACRKLESRKRNDGLGRPNLHAAVKPRTKQPGIIHDRVDMRAPAALKRADSPRARIVAGYELKRDRAHIILNASRALRRTRLPNCCLIALRSRAMVRTAGGSIFPASAAVNGRSKALQGEVLVPTAGATCFNR
jgi:hypothetical protein